MAARSGTRGLWQPSLCFGRGGSSGSIFTHRSSGRRQPSSCTGRFFDRTPDFVDIHKIWYLRALAPFYPDTVNYYGANTPRPKVMVEKQKFAERWPVRHYTVNLKSFSIQCATLCMADGIIGWDVSSQERNARSIGTARISFVLAGAGPFVITSENGSVINRSNQPLDGSGASNPPVAAAGGAAVISQAYNEGRDARLRYEDWFTKLPDGPFKDGVLFWVSNRSKTPTPMCFSSANAQNSDWLSGCGAAQRFFVTVDVRRKSDKDYWFGWNSL